MKRLFTLLLATCVMLSACGMLGACGGNEPPKHEHSFSQEWSKNEDYHWHACKGIGCSETADKQEHAWSGDGEMTCTVCGATKTEQGGGSDFSGEVTKEQWDLAVIAEKFNNVTISYELVQASMGKVKAELLIDGEKVYKKSLDIAMNLGYVGEQAKAQKDMVLNLFMGLIVKYENFTYDEQEGVYASTETVTTTVTDEISGYTAVETMTNGKVKFASDYTIEWLTCDMTETIYLGEQLLHSETYEDMLFTFKDFGTTVVDFTTEVPYIPQATYTQVNEEQWIASMSIDFDCQIKQTLTLLANNEFYYVMEDEFIRSGNVIKFSDWYISIEGDKYFEYYTDENGVWEKDEIDEEYYIRMATFAELIDAFSQSTFDAQTGLYTCDELDIDGGENTYYNLKMGFVDGKLVYVYYEEKTEGDKKPIYQCYLEYKTVEVTLPTVAE